MLLLIIALVGVLLFVLLNLMLQGKKTGVAGFRARMDDLRTITGPGDIVRYESEKLNRPFAERLFMPMLNTIVGLIQKITPVNIYNVAQAKKMQSGTMFPGNAATFLVLWLSTAIVFTCSGGYYFFLMSTDIDGVKATCYTLAAMIAGAYLPLLMMNGLISKRKNLILRQLPEMLDLVCVSVQAGMSFDGSLSKVTDHMKGPIVEECMKMLQEVRMGMTRRQALMNMAERCQLQEVSLFTASIIQSDRLGVSLSKTLVIQSENMRERRRQSVKAKALKAPVKIILPLVLFIFPSVFIIALVPSILTVMNSFLK